MRLFLIFIFASGVSFASEKAGLKVKNYHLKAVKTVWDSKAGVLNAEGDVVTTLFLQDGTTAYIYSNFAMEDRTRQRGKAWGNARLLWQDLTVKSRDIAFDANKHEVVFSGKGDLTHKSFVKGRLDMNFTTMTDTLDKQDQSMLKATDAKGVWTPHPPPPPAPVEKKDKGKKKK